MKGLPVIIIGAGGHAKVLHDILASTGQEIIGFVDPNPNLIGSSINGTMVLGNDETVLGYSPNSVVLANGIGSISSSEFRKEIYYKFKSSGYKFTSVIHHSAIISDNATFAEGVQIMAGAIVQPGCTINENTIINTKSSIDHDCQIGSHVHIGPGVTMSGGVMVGENTHIGTGATIIQNIEIGHGCTVGAGAVVIKKVENSTKVVGIPAREV